MEQYVRDQITKLRLKKGISEYQLSYDLGHSRSYINNISSGKSLPALNELFAICDYFQITPRDFFDQKIENPVLLSKIMEEAKELEEDDMLLLLTLIRRIKK